MKTNFKSFISGFIVCAILVAFSIPIFAKTETIKAFYNNIKMTINGNDIKFAQSEEPFIYNGRTYVPAKYICENLNASISWNEIENTIVIASKENKSSTNDNSVDSKENSNEKSIDKTSKDNGYRNIPVTQIDNQK